MLSKSTVLSLQGIEKRYELYTKPLHRLLKLSGTLFNSDKSYSRSIVALEHISFEIDEGETVAVIGRNGAGKSTLLSIISGNTAPTAGLISMRGGCSALLELGDGFDKDLSGRENLRLSAMIRGARGDNLDQLVDQAVKFADIGNFIDDPVKLYSSGMYVRVAFAAAIMFHSDLLIIDEALAVGDFFFQQKCFDYLVSEMNGVTKLLVTHDLSAVARLATRCIVLDRGKVIFDGPPLQAIEKYLSLTRSELVTKVDNKPATELDETQLEVGDMECVFRTISSKALVGGIETDRVSPGQLLTLEVKFGLTKRVSNPIFGYTVRDRVGNAVFGMNSISSGHEIPPLNPGIFASQVELVWPDIEDGSYSLTIGLGNGMHSHFHETIGWETGVLALTSISAKMHHGIFDGNIQSLSIESRSD